MTDNKRTIWVVSWEVYYNNIWYPQDMIFYSVEDANSFMESIKHMPDYRDIRLTETTV